MTPQPCATHYYVKKAVRSESENGVGSWINLEPLYNQCIWSYLLSSISLLLYTVCWEHCRSQISSSVINALRVLNTFFQYCSSMMSSEYNLQKLQRNFRYTSKSAIFYPISPIYRQTAAATGEYLFSKTYWWIDVIILAGVQKTKPIS